MLRAYDASGNAVGSAAVNVSASPTPVRVSFPLEVVAAGIVRATVSYLSAENGNGANNDLVVDDVEFSGAAATFASIYTPNPPVIDGFVDWGEWQSANTLQFSHGFIALLNDDCRLYLLIDVLQETVVDPNDYFWLSFDVDRNAAITPNVDVNYSFLAQTRNIRYQYYLGPNSWTGLQPNTRSSKGESFSASFADGSIQYHIPGGLSSSPHKVWELAIDLSEVNAAPGGTVHLGLRVASPAAGFADEMPARFSSDFSALLAVSLAPRPIPLVADHNAVIGLQTDPLEITQAVQTRQNTLPLVQDKRTVARAEVSVSGTASPQPVCTYLYGSRGAVDLPGSPLCKLFYVPTVVDRQRLSDTPYFVLPASWLNGSVDFHVKVRSTFGAEATSPISTLTFTPRATPTIWIVPINTGTVMTPTLVSDSEISSQQSFFTAMYPVPGVNFVRKPWTAIGPTTVDGTIPKLRDYFNQVVIAWIFGLVFTGSEPFELPRQIYGFEPSGGGISDPTWCSGNGWVARGFQGTSLEGTMAHEINHNLDRTSTGTWGHHTPFGCGAVGPDPAWPYANANVQEVGFDTRSPIAAASVVRTTFPDIMSYCQSGALPTKWITPYRWNNLFNAFPAGAAALSEKFPKQPAGGFQSVYFISGVLTRKGGGALNPILTAPGIASDPIPPGQYALQFQNVDGVAVKTIPFMASFVNVEGEPIDPFDFDFEIPVLQGVARVLLLHNAQVLASLRVSANPPTVRVTSPNGGEVWQGIQTVRWTASDPDGDALSFNLFYTPDDGAMWVPVATRVQGNSLQVDSATLPGGNKARIRIMATDGFNTAQDDSDATFTVPGKPPQPIISSPRPGATVAPGSIPFEGDATDLEDGTLPDTSLVWLDGETVIGYGRHVPATLAEGTHRIVLRATDSNGNTAEAAIDLLVSRSVLATLTISRNRDGSYHFTWPGVPGGILQSATKVNGQYQNVPVTLRMESDTIVTDVTPTGNTAFYRLVLPQ